MTTHCRNITIKSGLIEPNPKCRGKKTCRHRDAGDRKWNSLAAFLDTKDACIEHDNKVVQLLFYDLLGVGSTVGGTRISLPMLLSSSHYMLLLAASSAFNSRNPEFVRRCCFVIEYCLRPGRGVITNYVRMWGVSDISLRKNWWIQIVPQLSNCPRGLQGPQGFSDDTPNSCTECMLIHPTLFAVTETVTY